jgi:hypothetical protein
MSTRERRRAPRVFHALKVLVEWESGEVELASTIDLSTGGALLDVGTASPPSQVVLLRFETSPQVYSETAAVVRRCSPAFGGRRFVCALSFLEPQAPLFATACARESLLETVVGQPLTA